MHLEIIFKDPNRKKIFLSKTKTLCAVILSYHLPAVRSASFSASPAPAVE